MNSIFSIPFVFWTPSSSIMETSMTLHLHNIELHQFILYLAALRKCPQKSKRNMSEKSARKNKLANICKKKKDYWLAQEIKSRDRGADCHLLLPAVTLGGWSQRERERDLHLISLYLLFCKDFFWSYHQQTNTHFDFIIHEEVKMVLGVLQIIPSLLFADSW